ncbi:hypothetical protein ACEPAG_974 [Sanghuangporus baumii]
MARTRDRRPSADAEECQFAGGCADLLHSPTSNNGSTSTSFWTADMNGHENHRVYEENEWSAAEALMGINASPTTSQANEPPPPTSASSRVHPPPLTLQNPEKSFEIPQAHRRASATPRASASTNGRRRTRGRASIKVAIEDTDDSTISSAQDNGHSAGGRLDSALAEPRHDSLSVHSEPEDVRTLRQTNGSEHGADLREDTTFFENKADAPTMPIRNRRKRKRSESVSIAAVSRGRIDDVPDDIRATHERENGEHTELIDAVSQSLSESQTPASSAAIQKAEDQMQNEIGGPANPKTELMANGTNGRKSKPRNFDKVVFGRWLIKTWYYSPYPIQATEDDNMSASANPNRQSVAISANRGQQSKRGSARVRQRPQNSEDGTPAEKPMLWVCDKCFKYMQDGSLYELHSRFCDKMKPPGRIVYQRGAHVIYEIDGAKDKIAQLYCQNLSLFGKLFIDIKTLFYDCENFMFYVLTEGDRHQDHAIGFFSKEKVSYDDYNLACIITFPPYQRKRYGMLMIEFSYELSRRAGKLGTPERPLSELGLRTYLTYWTGALVQFFRRVLSVQPLSDIPRDQQRPVDDDLIRFLEARDLNRKRRKSGKDIGDNSYKNRVWEGGLENHYNTGDVVAATSGANDVLYSRMRWMRTSSNPDGSATTHVFARCTLEDIANATGIRTEDIAFTLHECGLLQKVQALDRDETEEVIVISREMVEGVAKEFKKSFSGIIKPRVVSFPESGCVKRTQISRLSHSDSFHIEHIPNVKEIDPEWAHDEIDEIMVIFPKPKVRNSFLDLEETKRSSIDEFEVLRVIGKEPSVQTILVRSCSDLGLYAIKTLGKRVPSAPNLLKHVRSEQECLRIVTEGDCSFLPKLHRSFQDEARLYMVLDTYPGGNIALHLDREGPFASDKARFYASEIVEALSYLHSLHIVHRDVKPENVMIAADGHVVLTSFSCAKVLDQCESTASDCGTREIEAPERILGWTYDYAVDVWSLGILLCVMHFGQHPFIEGDELDPLLVMQKRILRGQPPTCPGQLVPLSEWNLIKKCLERNALLRPKISQIKTHEYFQDIDWDRVKDKRYQPPYIPCGDEVDLLEVDEEIFHFYDKSDLPELDNSPSPAASDFDGFTFTWQPSTTSPGDETFAHSCRSSAVLEVHESTSPSKKSNIRSILKSPSVYFTRNSGTSDADKLTNFLDLRHSTSRINFTAKKPRKLVKKRLSSGARSSVLSPRRSMVSMLGEMSVDKAKLYRNTSRSRYRAGCKGSLSSGTISLPKGVVQTGQGIGFTYIPQASRSRLSFSSTKTQSCFKGISKLFGRGSDSPENLPRSRNEVMQQIYGSTWSINTNEAQMSTVSFGIPDGLGRRVDSLDLQTPKPAHS